MNVAACWYTQLTVWRHSVPRSSPALLLVTIRLSLEEQYLMFIVKHTWQGLSQWPFCPMYCICALWLGLGLSAWGGGGNGCTDHYINITSTLKAASLPLSDSLSFLTVCLHCSPPDNAPVPSSVITLRPNNNQEITFKAVCSGISPFNLSSSKSDNLEQKRTRRGGRRTIIHFCYLNYAKLHKVEELLVVPLLTCWVEKVDASTDEVSAKSCFLAQTKYVSVCVSWWSVTQNNVHKEEMGKRMILWTVFSFTLLIFLLLFVFDFFLYRVAAFSAVSSVPVTLHCVCFLLLLLLFSSFAATSPVLRLILLLITAWLLNYNPRAV